MSAIENPTPTTPGRCAVTTWPNLRETEGTAIDTTWDAWFDSLQAAPKFLGDMQHPGWSAAVLEPVVRAKSNVCGLSALVLDYDDGATLDAAEAHWREWYGLIHTTRKHRADAHRFRVILPFTRIVTPDEYETLWAWAEQIADGAGHRIDPATKDAARFWYMPGIARGGLYDVRRLTGTAIDPDPILRSASEPSLPLAPAIPLPPSSNRYGDVALERTCDRIRRASKGTRNDTLNREAYSIACLVAGGVIDDARARSALRDAGAASGLPDDEVLKTLGSAFSSGLKNPRTPPPLRLVANARPRLSLAGGTGTDGPAPEPANQPAMFKRGDHVELAAAVLSRIESPTAPVTFDDGAFWRYDHEHGIWREVERERVEHTVTEFAGAWIDTGTNYKPLPITAGTCKGTADVLRNHLVSRPGAARFAAARAGIAFSDRFVTVEGGVIQTHAHSADHLARAGLPFPYDPLTHPQLDAFFGTLFEDCEDAADRIALLQEFIGACLLGLAPSYQRCLVLYGTGNNGKSQVIDLARAAFPAGTVVALPPQQWEERFRLPMLVGALANFVGEMPTKEIAASETFKGIVTGDTQTAERKNRDPFTFAPRAGHLFASNSLPSSSDISAGFFRRFVVLPLTRVFEEDGLGVERDIGKRIASEERQAIAAWAVEGAARVQRQGGYTVPASARDLKEQWVNESDSVRVFLAERCRRVDKHSGNGLRLDDLYAPYQTWAKAHGFVPVNANTFSKRYLAATFERATIAGRARYYVRLLEAHEI
jgi:P4 family phage/plasmid primase-like protien